MTAFLAEASILNCEKWPVFFKQVEGAKSWVAPSLLLKYYGN